METNELGQVAVVHWNSNGSNEQVGDKIYTWTPQHGVSLCWVDAKDVNFLLSKRANVCCGQSKIKYMLASHNAVMVYNTGHY